MPCVSMVAFRGVSWNSSKAIPVPPKTVNQNAQKSDGTSNTPNTNCRTVRPLEILAMKVPTKGAQAIHQAQ